MSGKIRFFRIPEIPSQVDLSDLHNGLLLTEEQLKQFAKLKESPAFQEDRRYSKKETSLGYGLIRHEGKYWLIYKGKKHSLGAGRNGSAKLIQLISEDLDYPNPTRSKGEFYVLKLTNNSKDAAKEHDILKATKQTDTDSPPTPRRSKSNSIKNLLMKTHQKSIANLGLLNITPDEASVAEQGQIIMHLISGISIERLIDVELDHIENELFYNMCEKNEDPLDPARFLIHPALRMQLIIAVFKAIHELHLNYNMLHCDLHPGNILVDRAKQSAYLIDYGYTKKFDPSNPLVFTDLAAAISYVPEVRERLKIKMDLEERLREEEQKLCDISVQEQEELLSLKNKIEENKNLDALKKIVLIENCKNKFEKQKESPRLACDELLKNPQKNPVVVYSTSSEAYLAGGLGAKLIHADILPECDDPRTWHIEENGIVKSIQEIKIQNCLPAAEYQQMIDVMNQVATTIPTERLAFPDAITKMEIILQEYIRKNNIKLNTAIVDVAEYLEANPAQKKQLIERAQQYDEVWLIDTNKKRQHTLHTYLQVKRELGLVDLHAQPFVKVLNPNADLCKEKIQKLSDKIRHFQMRHNAKLVENFACAILHLDHYLQLDAAEKANIIKSCAAYQEVWLMTDQYDLPPDYLETFEAKLGTTVVDPDKRNILGVPVGDKVAWGSKDVNKLVQLVEKDLAARPVPSSCSFLTVMPELGMTKRASLQR